jgi:hypothetical protein
MKIVGQLKNENVILHIYSIKNENSLTTERCNCHSAYLQHQKLKLVGQLRNENVILHFYSIKK